MKTIDEQKKRANHFASNQGRRKESRARGADRSSRAPTTLGQKYIPEMEGIRGTFCGIS